MTISTGEDEMHSQMAGRLRWDLLSVTPASRKAMTFTQVRVCHGIQAAQYFLKKKGPPRLRHSNRMTKIAAR